MSDAVTANEHHLVAELTSLLVDDLGIDLPSSTCHLLDDGIIDSLGFVELLFALEQRYGVAVPLDELDLTSFATVDALARFVASSIPA